MTLPSLLHQAASCALYVALSLVFGLFLFVLACVLLVIGPLFFAVVLIFLLLAAIGSLLFPAARH